MTQPLVSILITAYNAAPWLDETLRSALGQTWPNVEIIVVDDGSTDASAEIAEGYADERLVVIRQENRGACAARNRALSASTGTFVQYLDADDILAPDKIERQVRRLLDAPEGSVATGPWVRFSGDVSTADRSWRGPDWRDFTPATDWLIESGLGRGMIPSFSWLIPRDLAIDAGPWNASLLVNQDGEYMARVLVRASALAFCDGAWGFYRSGIDGSVSRRRSDAALHSLVDAARLCEATLLSARNTPETRAACAGLWQHTHFAVFQNPDLARIAERRVEALGGSDLVPSVIRPLRPVRDLLGWKLAFRMQQAYVRSGLPHLLQRIRG